MNTPSSFNKFGSKFQTRVLQALLNDKVFYEEVSDIIKEIYFSSNAHAFIFNKIKNFYEKKSVVPTLHILEVESQTIEELNLKAGVKNLILEIKNDINVVEMQFARDKSFDFCKNKAFIEAFQKSADLLEQEKFQEIQMIFENVLRSVDKTSLGNEYFSDLSRLTTNKRIAVPSGFPLLDAEEYFDGGLGVGEIGFIVAPSGGGKSFWLVNFGYGALKAGKNVLHYTLELSENNIAYRYDARITGVPIKQLVRRKDEVEEGLKNFDGGNLIIKQYPTKSTSINAIKAHISKLQSIDFVPDMIIVDYADLMNSRKEYSEGRFELKAITEDLRGLGMELNVPVWTASQTNREGYKSNIITSNMIGESISKIEIADLVLTYSGRNFLHIAKNRNGKDNATFSVKMDAAKSLIEVVGLTEENEEDSKTTLSNLFAHFSTGGGSAN